MANVATLFVDPAGDYVGGYTSETVEAAHRRGQNNTTRGVIQANVEVAGPVSLQMRVSLDARWVEVAVYTEDTIEEVVMGNYMRVVVTGDAKVWIGETR